MNLTELKEYTREDLLRISQEEKWEYQKTVRLMNWRINEANASEEKRKEGVYFCYVCNKEIKEEDWRDHLESESHKENQKTYHGNLLCRRYLKREGVP